MSRASLQGVILLFPQKHAPPVKVVAPHHMNTIVLKRAVALSFACIGTRQPSIVVLMHQFQVCCELSTMNCSSRDALHQRCICITPSQHVSQIQQKMVVNVRQVDPEVAMMTVYYWLDSIL